MHREVVQGRADQRLTYDVWGPGVVPGAFEAYLLHHGMPAEDAARSAGDEGDTPVHPAEPTRLVDEGDTVEIAGEPFGVLLMPGHADGHIVLYGERQRPLLRRRRAAARDHAERGALGGHGARPARPLPRDAAAHRATSRRASSTPGTAP